MKGVANHRRIEILVLLKNHPEQSVTELTNEIKVDFRTVAEHIRKMQHAGLIMKRSDGRNVRHALTQLGEHVLRFFDTIANQ